MNQRNQRPRTAAPRQTGTGWSSDVVDAMVEEGEDVVTRARPATPSALIPYARQHASMGRPMPPPPEPERTEPHALSYPFPQWLTLGVPVALALTLAAVFVGETNLLGGDWATGALAVSFTAFALAVVTVGVLIGRVALGRRNFGTVALGGLLALALVGSGASGVALANPLRQAQASQAMGAKNWQVAVNEYVQAGEKGPNAPGLALAYTEWGEAALASGDYATATNRLTLVVDQFASSGSVVARARVDLFKTYGLWITSGAITLPFKQSLDFLTAYYSDPACDSACQQQVTNLMGQAHYQYGEQLVNAGQFKPAIAEFALVQTTYAKSAFAAQAHTAAAAAYWSLGHELLTQDCVSAVPYYRTLALHYGDTTQGKQAKAALAARVKVMGMLMKTPTKPSPTIYLSRYIDPTSNTYSHDYKASFNAKTGVFIFINVAQGKYHLTTFRSTSTTEYFTSYTVGGKPEVITVGPLCVTQIPSRDY